MIPDFKRYIAPEIVSSLVGGALSAATALGGTAMRNAAQRRENELAFEREKQQIREQNAYNSPSAQMARMAAAGLNPNLMYQQGEQGLQADTAHYTPAELVSGVEPLGNVGQQVIDSVIGLKDMENKTQLAQAELLVKASVADLNRANYHYTKVQGKNILDRLGMDKEFLEYKKGLTESQMREAESAADYNKKLGEKASTETLIMQLMQPLNEEKLKTDIQYRREAVRELTAKIQYLQRMDKYYENKQLLDWLNFGVNVVDTGINVAAMLTKLKGLKTGGAKSMEDYMGQSPFDAVEKGGSYNDFQDFLAGD